MKPCRVKDCKHKLFKNKKAEAMHYHRVHSRKIVLTASRRSAQPVLQSKGNGHSKVTLLVDEPVADRRTRTWREANPDQAKPIGVRSRRSYSRRVNKTVAAQGREVKIRYCPECGLHLESVALGMALAKTGA